MPKRKAAAKKPATAKKTKATPSPKQSPKNSKVGEKPPDESTDQQEATDTGKRKTGGKTNEETPAKLSEDNDCKKTADKDNVDEQKTADSAPAGRTTKEIVDALKKAAGSKKRTHKVDASCNTHIFNGKVVDDYDCTLNQTNIGSNNNKYYIIQLIQSGTEYYTWNRWGRVGEPGSSKLFGPSSLEQAVKNFTSKFRDKTKNKWEDRDSFKPVSGSYTLLEMGDDEEEQEDTTDAAPKKVLTEDCLPCSLDQPTQELIKLIFDNNMFKDALKTLEIDVKKMPLGKISKIQIAKGFEILEQIEEALKNNVKSKLTELSSQFYTHIPHDFGRQKPPAISDNEMLRKKMDMLLVLADIELAQSMQKDSEEKTDKRLHPLDAQYEILQCGLKLMDNKSDLYQILEKYLLVTQQSYSSVQILDIWEVDRKSEGLRFATNDTITNRKLLWHGTNVAVVAAILKSGLRIMPHSGGRVGRGIYFASENSKSAGYVQTTMDRGNRVGIMFLNEVALGMEHHILRDNSSLTQAPRGFDSVVAKGRTEPDPRHDVTITLDGKKVTVPQGKPVAQKGCDNSSFSQSEYLIYREDQCRIRYVLKLKF